MGKATGFLEYKRVDNTAADPISRVKSFDEFRCQAEESVRREQGGRCMNCGVPFCQAAIELKGRVTGCPLHNLIPEWNDEVYNGNFSHAFDRLQKTNNFPEFTGRVCPALCEKACINAKYDDAVTVHENELFVIETAFKNGYVKPRIPAVRSGWKIAVVGSGPAGLACADQLNHRGHNVTVYEKSDRIGGLLMYGIPNMKLDKSVVERRVKLMEEEGVKFVTKSYVGKADAAGIPAQGDLKLISAEWLLQTYDAVILCCGAEVPRPLEAWENEKKAGVNISGVYNAMEYLSSATRSLLDGTESISAAGLNVVVVGGGDTGNDCLGTAVRQGAASITQIVRKKAGPAERMPSNPWPEWPDVEKTDYGQEECIAVYGADPRRYETGVKSLKYDENHKLTGVELVSLGRKNGKYVELEGTEEVIPADLLIVASGFSGCSKEIAESFGAELERGSIRTAAGRYSTGIDKLFAAGDVHRGPSLVVWAIAEGRSCASEVDEYLVGYHAMEKLI